ncbi:MAG: hypothetical protein JEZ05_05810 [Tenericutes bacterium]|nr:hypothetical protein [Mycoplasmatota bacterium]
MNIKNKTLYDKDLILEYNKYYLSSYLKKNFLIMSAISLVFIVYMLAIQQWKYALILLGILAFYLLMTFLMQKVTTKRILRRSPLVSQPVLQSYEFMEENMKVFNIKEYTVEYESILRFKKGKDFFILQSKDKKTYIVSFKGFERSDDLEVFEDFMKEKLKKK